MLETHFGFILKLNTKTQTMFAAENTLYFCEN